MLDLAGRCLIDTNVLIYATVGDDPRHSAAIDILRKAQARDFEALVSVQNLAEMYPNLTGPKRKPPDSPELARRKIESIAHLQFLQVLPVTDAVLLKALELCQEHQVRRQDYFDMQLAATMLLHSIHTLITENVSDFAANGKIRTVTPFE